MYRPVPDHTPKCQMLMVPSLLNLMQKTTRPRNSTSQPSLTSTITFWLDENGLRAAVSPILGKFLTLTIFVHLLNPHRALKRTKAYNNLEDVRPTIRNKPSGLKVDWHRSVSKPSMPHHQVSVRHPRSTSMSVSSSSLSASSSSSLASSSSISASPTLSQSPPQEFSDHALSLLALSPPRNLSQSSIPPFHGSLESLDDERAVEHQENVLTDAVCIFFSHHT